ncbi:MAG: pentapeptide repeat-containing protein [Acidiferrobacterales bacterium]
MKGISSLRSRRTVRLGVCATLLALISAPVSAVNQRHLNALLASHVCNGCNLTKADLRGKQLRGVKLRWAVLDNADLRGTDLSGADLTGASLKDAQLANTNLQGAKLEGADLRGVDLTEVTLIGADLRWADLRHLDVDLAFEFVELIGVRLEGARFKHGVRCAGFPAKGGWGCKTE